MNPNTNIPATRATHAPLGACTGPPFLRRAVRAGYAPPIRLLGKELGPVCAMARAYAPGMRGRAASAGDADEKKAPPRNARRGWRTDGQTVPGPGVTAMPREPPQRQ